MMGLPAEGMDAVILRVFYLKVKAGKKKGAKCENGRRKPPTFFLFKPRKERNITYASQRIHLFCGPVNIITAEKHRNVRFQLFPRLLNGRRPLGPDGFAETPDVVVNSDCLDHSGIGMASYPFLIFVRSLPLLSRPNSPGFDAESCSSLART